MKKLKLNDVFPDWYNGGGLFTALQATGGSPWGQSGVSAQLLDMEYHGNRSGSKTISPALMAISGGEEMDENARRVLASNLLARFGDYWEKLWDTLSLSYNPIENYSMTEEMSNDQTVDQYGKTHTRTDNLTHGKTGTDTTTPNTSETETPNTTSTTQNKTHGFNTTEGVPSDDSTTTETGSTTRTKTGTEQTTYNTTETNTGTQQDTDGGTDTRTRNYRLTRSGNIGVTTSQQMLQSERELWQSWDFFRTVVFPSLDNFLTLPLY